MAVGARQRPELTIDLRAVVYHEGKLWLAHCLEMDVVAEGDSPRSAFLDLQDLCAFQIEFARSQDDLKSVFRAAPQDIWMMYWRARTRRFSASPPEPLHRFDAREFSVI